MRLVRVLSLTISAALVSLGLAVASAHASTIPVTTTTTDGTVAGTAITYTVTSTGSARNVFTGTRSSDNGTWTWDGFPEFLALGGQTVTVTFSAPLPIDRIVLGLNSTSASLSTLVLAGGTAGTADFDLTDGLESLTGNVDDVAVYDGATGTITASTQNASVMIGSTSSATITSFTLNAGASDGGGDGYTAFVGFTDSAPVSPVPEPGSLVLLGTGVLGALGGVRRKLSKV
jgi:hypothetical protein